MVNASTGVGHVHVWWGAKINCSHKLSFMCCQERVMKLFSPCTYLYVRRVYNKLTVQLESQGWVHFSKSHIMQKKINWNNFLFVWLFLFLSPWQQSALRVSSTHHCVLQVVDHSFRKGQIQFSQNTAPHANQDISTTRQYTLQFWSFRARLVPGYKSIKKKLGG